MTTTSKQFDGGQEMSMWITLMHEAMGAKLGISGTDLKCLSLIRAHDDTKPSDIASWMGLTRGSVTTMLDRLERSGYVERRRHDADGRQVRLVLRPERHAEIGALYASLGQRMGALYGEYTPQQLQFIQQFMEALTETFKAEIEALNQKI